MRRVAQVVRLRPEAEREYRRLHAAVWPEVLDRLRRSGIRNYSIHLRDGLLFGYFEHHGDDLDADLRAVAADPATRRWWELTAPCQEPLPTAGEGEWWVPAETVFVMDDQIPTEE